MSTARHHADWLSLVEVSGPFVSLPVLLSTFPQGLEARDPAQAKQLRAAYEDWQDNPAAPGKQRAWVLHVLGALLGFPASQIAEGQALPAGLEATMAEQGETLRPDFALIGPAGTDAVGLAQLLISSYPAAQPLDKPVIGKHWKATPATRMMELLHGTNVPLGLVTNGEQWMLVYAPRGETTGYASWYGALWLDEPITLRAFQSLLGVRRFFGVAADSTLLALLKESATDQQEVTDQLGYQVREAVEVLVQSFDAIHQESQEVALKGIPPTTVYDAALTIMMRLVFLFSAEERGLLHLGKPLYDNNYAVSTLQEQLQEVADQNGEEVLERRYDAWTRLLATFRAVHGGIQHQDLLMQAYGGSLFDPDRYPFLEGRAAGTNWRGQSADPLPVNNRVVLHLLNSLQRLRIKTGGAAETRRVSFRALGVEQIGHVYEGLLDHTAQRAAEVVLGIRGTRSKEPEIPLSTLEQLLAKGEDALLDHLKEETGRSLPALRKELNSTSVLDEHKLLVACRQDQALLARLRPFAGLIREDSFERPWVVLPGSVFVTTGTTRRSTGTHYTPPSLTEPIVRHTLEPLVYVGPAEGLPKEEWKLKSPKEILELKVCDMAMGSGAFLVQACRYLAERLVEAWENEEKSHPGQVLITPDGKFSEGAPTERLVPAEAAERIAIARRVVADRCLYGVDINPMAVEMAKLSMWLITVDKSRPFNFLDHAFKCGDSLLGITSLEQLENFSLRSEVSKQQAFATLNLQKYIAEAQEKREIMESMPSDTPDQISNKRLLFTLAEEAVSRLTAAADALVGFELKVVGERLYEVERQNSVEQLTVAWSSGLTELQAYSSIGLCGRRPMHWILSYPEIVFTGGFDAFIGNPPFLGGRKISTAHGDQYERYLKATVDNAKGSGDLCSYFFRRAHTLLSKGCMGLVATNSIKETESKEIGIRPLLNAGSSIYRASSDFVWPGSAGVVVVVVHICKGISIKPAILDGKIVSTISPELDVGDGAPPRKLKAVRFLYSQGTTIGGDGFVLTQQDADTLLKSSPRNQDVVRPYLNGELFNNSSDFSPEKFIIDFGVKSLSEAASYSEPFAIVEKNVKPYREKLTRQVHEERYWLFWDKREKFYDSIRSKNRVLICSRVTTHLAFGFVSANWLFSEALKVFDIQSTAAFSVLQSIIHEVWARKYSSTLGLGLRYSTTDAFETFPFPVEIDSLEFIGNKYIGVREHLMLSRRLGLTGAYNLLHDPNDNSLEVLEFREVSADLNSAVAALYGWTDIDMQHGFHETKQGIRFTVHENIRLKLLSHLLELNHRRYAEEVAAGLHEKKSVKPAKIRKVIAGSDVQDDLFGMVPTVSTPVQQRGSDPSPIVEYMRANPGWNSKDDILTATGFPDNRWNVTIRELLDRGQVIRQGEKRGAKYRLAETQQ